MSRLITRKPLSDTKLNFAPMGQKPGQNKPAPAVDKEDAADARKPGDAKEDANANSQQKNTKKSGKSAAFFAKKAASKLAGK